MRLVIISGRSGSGKSTALNVLEDVGFSCIDNLPASLLPSLVKQYQDNPRTDDTTDVAVSIDARNPVSDLKSFPDIYQQLQEADISIEIIYLDARQEILIKRFSETRRRHPLSITGTGLQEALDQEAELLSPIKNLADLTIDTSQLNLYALRDLVKTQVAIYRKSGMLIQFISFGFKHSVPVDTDFVFDVRCLPNPYWDPALRSLNGTDSGICNFLEKHDEVHQMLTDISGFLEIWLPKFAAMNRSYVTIAIGCTGGQHRSVYLSERLYKHFSKSFDNVILRHRELGQS
ncbi:MAG: RNase adapter RapZ [Cellvibrionaceae bacterium]